MNSICHSRFLLVQVFARNEGQSYPFKLRSKTPSRVSYPLENVSTLSTGSGSSKDTHAEMEKSEERTF